MSDTQPEDSNVIAFKEAKEKYNYQALLRGYQEIFESKLQELRQTHLHDMLSFAQVMEEAQHFMIQVNDKRGWSQASPSDLREMEKMCTEMDEILHTHARFLDRRKVIDVGQRLLNQEYLGQPKEAPSPLEFEEARKRRAAGYR